MTTPTRHPGYCYDNDGELECACGVADIPEPEPWPADYGDPLLDREPMGGNPYWRGDDQ